MFKVVMIISIMHLMHELELVRCLLTQGAGNTIKNGDGKMPLQLAEECNHAEIIDGLESCIAQVGFLPSETDILPSYKYQPVAANPNKVSVCHSNLHAAATGKQTLSTVLPLFSGKLRVDSELILSHAEFKQSIQNFYENSPLSAIVQLEETPLFPTPHVLVQFASLAYNDHEHVDPEIPVGWKLLTTASNCGIKGGYFGIAYWNPKHQQVVIAHRGTDIKNVGSLVTDIHGVVFNNYVEQMSSASTFVSKVVTILQEIEQEKKVNFELFFTGHSLGGWLAQIATFTTEYLEVKGSIFRKKLKKEQDDPLASSTLDDSHDVRETYHPHTVVFDSAGCKNMLSQMADKFDVSMHGNSIDLQHLDITTYLSAPNLINTCNSHLGTIYRIFADLSDTGWKEKYTPLYNLATHSMDKIVQAFDPETGQVRKDDKGRLKIREVVDWPISAGLKYGAELNDFFKWAEHLNNYHSEELDIFPSKVPKGYHLLRYQTKSYDELAKGLSAFTQDEREFLEGYRWLHHVSEFFTPEDLLSVMNNTEAKKEVKQKLQNLEFDKESIRCPDATTLHTLIPYVKRLLQLFPHIKKKVKDKLSPVEIRSKVYQYETQLSIGKIEKSALDFKPEALGLKEFLTSDQQVWQLRMVDGDVWTGITKVYRVLQNTSCTPNYSSDGHYTILKLKRLIFVNRIINMKALLTTMKTPHLLMIACGKNQPMNEELRYMFKKLFGIIKQKKAVKIILTTQSEEEPAALIEQIARKALGEGFITKDEKLNWSDLTSSSQTEILKKTVIFQGRRVSLNQLISNESMTDSFLFINLLQETEIRIGKELAPFASSGYNEKYYIGRTFNHNITVRQDISRHKMEGRFDDLLASSEKEFKQLCQQNLKGNVHWLEKDIAGELIWKQSRGNLTALRGYIDTQKSHSYSPSDLDHLLQEAKHLRSMIISDSAGTGKSTVLTHLSERIKQNFPAHWVVRIYLNDYTEVLAVHKGKNVDKRWVLEFLSNQVLKLVSPLDKELFKKSFEGNEVNKVVVMVDGFDEISPSYKETVIDMLQVLKQTSLEQLWVTTRPHLREELEDNLQQVSYTLQPFSEVEQVEYLKKFWLQTLNLEPKNEHRLEIYAKALIRKLAESISDKDREFTGIPLQTRMLAEAFKEYFVLFYLSEKSEPELPQKLDLLGLYRRFIDRKYNIFYKEKSKFQPDNMGADGIRERESRNIQVAHQLLALQALFTEEQDTFLKIQRTSTFTDEDLVRIGIVQRNSEDKPHFIHRTFAEYFVADFLINQLTDKTKQHVQVKEILVNKVLLQKECHVIRAFMDGLLENSKPSTEALKEYGDLLDGQWNKGEVQRPLIVDRTALHEAAAENNVRVVGFLLKSLKSGEHSNALKVMLLAKDDKRRTAWHVAAEAGHINVLDNLWIWAKTQLNPVQLKAEFLLGRDSGERTAWHVAAQTGRVQVLIKLWDWDKELLLKSEELRNEVWWSKDNYGQTAWHMAAESGHVEVLEKLWEWAKELQLKPQELKNEMWLSKDLLYQTLWQIAARKGHVEVLETLWDWAKELQLYPEELRNEAWLSKDGFHKTAWHMAAVSGHIEILEKLLEWAKDLQLEPEALRNEVLLSKDKSGKTAWQMAAESGHVEVLEKLWEWAKELQIKPKELKNKMWLSRDLVYQTPWHIAARSGHVEVLEILWDWAKELHRNPDELRNEVLLLKDGFLYTAFHIAAVMGHKGILEKLWEWAKELQLKPEVLRNKVWFSKGIFDQTVWHVAAKNGHVEVLEKLWEWAKELQLKPQKLRKELWFSKDKLNDTAWHMAAINGHVEVLEKLWDWAKELQLKPKDLRNGVLLSKGTIHVTAWHMAAGRGHVEVLEKLWGWAKELQLNPKDLRNEVLLSKGAIDETAWQMAAKEGHVEVLGKLWEWAKELQLKPEELRNEVWFSKNMFNETAWCLAAETGHLEVLKKLWDWAKDLQLKPEEIKNEVLLSKDMFDQMAWHIAAREGHVEVLEKLWDWAKNLQLKPEELRNDVLLSKDMFGQTGWHIAAREGHVNVLEKLWNWAKEMQLNRGEVLSKVLLSKDKYGQGALQMEKKNNFKKILDRGKELQKEIEELMN